MRFLLICLTAFFVSCNSGDNNSDTPEPNQDSILILNKSANSAWQIDAEDGQKIAEYQTGEAPHEVAVSPDQSRAIITNYGGDTPGNTLTIINIDNQQVSKTIALEQFRRPHGVEWLSNGNQAIVTAEEQQAIIIADIDSGEIVDSIDTDQEVSHMVELGPEEKTAFVTNLGSGSVSILGLTANEVIQHIKTGSGTEGITYVPDKDEVWITNRNANTISILNTASREIVDTLESSTFPIRAETSANGQWVAVSNAKSSEVSIFDVESREPIQKLSTVGEDQQGMPIGLTFSPNGNRLYVANSNSNQIAVINTDGWQVNDTFTTGITPDGIAYIRNN